MKKPLACARGQEALGRLASLVEDALGRFGGHALAHECHRTPLSLQLDADRIAAWPRVKAPPFDKQHPAILGEVHHLVLVVATESRQRRLKDLRTYAEVSPGGLPSLSSRMTFRSLKPPSG